MRRLAIFTAAENGRSRHTGGRTDGQTQLQYPRCACAPRVNHVSIIQHPVLGIVYVVKGGTIQRNAHCHSTVWRNAHCASSLYCNAEGARSQVRAPMSPRVCTSVPFIFLATKTANSRAFVVLQPRPASVTFQPPTRALEPRENTRIFRLTYTNTLYNSD